MSITQSHIEPSSSFRDDTYDFQRIRSYQPFTTEFVDSTMNISNLPEINRIHTLFCMQQTTSVNPNVSFSPLRYFRNHCLVKQIAQIRNLSPFQQPYNRNKTLINTKPIIGLSGNIVSSKPFVKSHSYIQHKESGLSKFTSVISDRDKYVFNNSEKQTKDSFVNNSCNTENLSTLIKVSTELQNKKEIQTKQKVTYTHSFHPFTGFCAFTYKNQNEKTFDKVDIGINKSIFPNKSQSSSLHKSDDKSHSTFHSHFFGLFQGKSSSDGANYFKEKYRNILFQKPNLMHAPITAMFETHREIDSILKSSSKNTTIDSVHSCILFTLDNKMYLLSKGNSKCIISLRDSSAVYSLVKVKTSRNMSRREFLQMLGDHTPSPPKARKGTNLQVQSYQYLQQDSIEVSEINMNNEIDFLLIMNENLSKHVTYKECMIIVYKTIFECQCRDVPYKDMLETVISNICIEATQNKAKNSLSLLFLPQERLKTLYEKGSIVNTQVILQNIMDSPSSNFNSIYPLMKIHEETDGKNTRNCSSASFESYQQSGGSWTSMDETNLSLSLKNQRKKSRFCCGLFS